MKTEKLDDAVFVKVAVMFGSDWVRMFPLLCGDYPMSHICLILNLPMKVKHSTDVEDLPLGVAVDVFHKGGASLGITLIVVR